jgi:poly(3-hydroxybutyrate) depolymerase
MRTILSAAFCAALLTPLAATAQVSSSAVATVEGKAITVFTYKPACAVTGILFVFHGNERTASSYRDASKPLADRECLSIYAPLFDAARFPSSAYHRGGVVANGPTTGRTVDLVDDLMAWAYSREKRPGTPIYLYGHSAGGQFMSRVAAYAPPAAAVRIIVTNPSTHVLPTVAEDAAYGFDMKTDNVLDQAEEALLRAYLAAPVTVFLGMEDTGTQDLAMDSAAMRQGENRLDRGLNTFDDAVRMAEERGWEFNWRLVTANGIGHAGGEMLRSPEMLDALGWGTDGSSTGGS